MLRPFFLAGMLSLVLTIGPIQVRAVGAGNDFARLTVYSGIAEFTEERTIDMQPGLNTIQWRSLMPKAYIRTIRVVAEGVDLVREDVTYDGPEVQGQKSPVLHLILQNKGAAGPKRVQVDYLAPGINWGADYALVLDTPASGAPPTVAALDSWVAIYNSTATDLSADALDVVAGDVSFVQDGATYGRNDYNSQRVVQTANMYAGDDANEVPVEATAEVGSLSAFARIGVGRGVAIDANTAVARFPLFQRARLAVEQRNVFENSYSNQTFGRGGFTLLPAGLEVRIVTKNSSGVPMPAGTVTLYSSTSGVAQIVGQDRIGLTPKDGEFSVSQGRSTTLLGTRKIVERREIPYRLGDDTRTRLVTKIEVTVMNRGGLEAETYIREGVEPFRDNQWTVVESSTPSERLGANLMQFKVKVPAGGKTTVTYTVETK